MRSPLVLQKTTPHRSLWTRRGVVFCVLASPITFSGCSLAPPAPLFPAATPLPAAKKRAQEAARYRSVNEALSKINAQTMKAWIDRWTAPGALSQGNTPPAVRINTEALAHRHPAWILADALEKGSVSPASPQIARVLAVPGPNAPVARPVEAELMAVGTVPARNITENFDSAAARRRQSTAQDSFFASAAARDALRGRDEAFLARRALEDSIAAFQRGAVAELDLSLIPPDVALELTNLRLQLLRSLNRTPAQRAASRAEIKAIEDRFAQIWREQTELQAARLRDVTVDVPAQQRKEGLARIERDFQTEAQKRATARGSLAIQAKAPLARDFDPKATELHLNLPATRKVNSVTARSSGAAPEFFETMPVAPPSIGPQTSQALTSPHRFDPKIALALRNKARGEARQWASLVAAQMGSRWNNSTSNPDRTATALAILFPVTGD